MSALQLQIRPPLMRSCPGDPGEEEDGRECQCLPLTQPMRGGSGGGPLGDPPRVRGRQHRLRVHTVMCCDSVHRIDMACIN